VKEIDLLGAVADIATVVVTGSVEADHARRLPEATVNALRESGLLAVKVPAVIGGLEAGLPSLFDLLEALAFLDGASGWVTGFLGTSGAWPASRIDDDGIDEVTSGTGAWPLIAGTFVPAGRAAPVDGGFQLQGRWGFASGIRHAAWVVAGAVRVDTGALVWCVVPTSDLTVYDTWDALGLRGTGSCDFAISDAFVPTSRTFSVLDPPRRGGPLYRLPIHAFLTPDHTAIALGCARRALEEAARGAVGNLRVSTTVALGNRPAFQRDLGRAETRLASARTQVRDVIATVWSVASAGVMIDEELLLECRTVATLAAEVAVDVATFAHRAGGAHALVGDSRLDRAYRDAMTATQHVHVTDEVYERRGEAMLARLTDAT
jgi:alkylation response protein AidB-like acyl-CoA dehydrogenase